MMKMIQARAWSMVGVYNHTSHPMTSDWYGAQRRQLGVMTDDANIIEETKKI